VDLHRGPGGFTIQIQSGRLRLTQRYYDSFGFCKPQEANAGRRMRHPEHTVADTSAACALPLSAIRVQLDHKLNVAVAVNGSELIRQPCLLDVSRHQLAYTIAGENAGTVRGRLAPRAEDHPTVLIDTSKRRQTMMGFGGITSPTAFAQLSAEGKRRWWRLLAPVPDPDAPQHRPVRRPPPLHPLPLLRRLRVRGQREVRHAQHRDPESCRHRQLRSADALRRSRHRS
jgi:hypothetical protein